MRSGRRSCPALLRAIDGYSAIGDKQTALALRLLCLTFVRTVELIGAECYLDATRTSR